MFRSALLNLPCFLHIAANGVDGPTFLKLTRDDLKDIFPNCFMFRKKLWDYLEDCVSVNNF